MPRLLGRWAPRAVAWVLVPALGIALRLVPTWSNPGNTWVADAAGHYRLVAALVDHGRLPDPDTLTDLPRGRSLGRFLPLGLYTTAAAWHHAAAWFGERDLGWSLSRFTAVAGALIAWPAWVGARAIGAGPWGAAVAALVAVAAPAHLQRTTAFMLRYDALGSLWFAVHLLLGAAALGASKRRRALMLSILSGLGLVGALAVWRVPLLAPVLEAVCVTFLAIARPPSAALRLWMGATGAALVVACVMFQYLRAQSHLFSLTTAIVVAIAAVLQIPFLSRSSTRVGTRAAAILLAVVAAAALSAWLAPGGDYEALGKLLRVRLTGILGLGGTVDPMARVMLSVKELGPMAVHELWGPSGFSWLALWLLAAPVALWLRSGCSLGEWVRAGRDPLVMTLAVTGGLVALSLFAMRHRILLDPLVASLAGLCVSRFANEGRGPSSLSLMEGAAQDHGRHPATPATGSPSTRRKRAARGRALATRGRIVGRLALGTLVPCLAILLNDAWSSAIKSVTRLDPGMSATIAYLQAQGERGPVLNTWDRGYELQRYASCATVTDGLLESEVNQEHILTAARAYLASTPDSLAALCERFGVRYLVVPPSWHFLGEAMAAGDPLAAKMKAGLSLSPQEADRVLIRMMLKGTREPPFEPVFESGRYRVYRRIAQSPPRQAASGWKAHSPPRPGAGP